MMIKKLLRQHRYPPEGMDDAVQTVMTQCELWADNEEFEDEHTVVEYTIPSERELKAAEKNRKPAD